MIRRPPRNDGKLRVSIHKNNGYWYASTQPCVLDPKTGREVYRHIHWGVVDKNLKFIPGTIYIYASPEERDRLEFSPEWDLSEILRLSDRFASGIPALRQR